MSFRTRHDVRDQTPAAPPRQLFADGSVSLREGSPVCLLHFGFLIGTNNSRNKC